LSRFQVLHYSKNTINLSGIQSQFSLSDATGSFSIPETHSTKHKQWIKVEKIIMFLQVM